MLKWNDWLDKEPPIDKRILIAQYALMNDGRYRLLFIKAFLYHTDYWYGPNGCFYPPARSSLFKYLWAEFDEPKPTFKLWENE